MREGGALEAGALDAKPQEAAADATLAFAPVHLEIGDLLLAAIDQLDEIVLLLRPDTAPGAPPHIVFANAAVERMLGMRRHGPMLGEYHRDITPVDLQPLRSLVAEGLDCHAPAHCHVNWTTTTGTVHCLDVSSVPVRAPGAPEVSHWAVVARDVAVQQALTDRSAHAQRLEILGMLAGSIAHDFNNLVHVVTGFSELALAQLPRTGPATRYVQQAHEAGLRASALAKQLLAFSKRQSVKSVHVNLRAVIDGPRPVLARIAGPRVRVVIAMDDRPAIVCADPTQLEQILLNLVVNARDAQPDGGSVSVSLDVVERSAVEYVDGSAVRGGDMARSGELDDGPACWVRLRVIDAGPGMLPEVQQRVFEPFFTTKSQGTGLGLSTVHRIVREGHGAIRLHSPVEGGLEVEVLLPQLMPDSLESRE